MAQIAVIDGLGPFVAIFALAVALLVTIDLGRFKGDIEDYVAEKTGRQLVIAGTF